MSNIKVLVATHKDYEFPEDEMYTPIHVGKGIKNNGFGVMGDDSGDHISLKNQTFCEITGLYWAWKNEFFKEYDYCGLVHYRRYFFGESEKLKEKSIASGGDFDNILKKYDMIVPRKRNYYIESIYKHYSNAHYEKDMVATRDIISAKYPEYEKSFDYIMSNKKLHLFNMFIMKTEKYNEYCEWLFDVLFKLEQTIDIENYDAYQRRVFGFLAERLFNVWVHKNKLTYFEQKTVNLDGENLFLKAIGLLKRKFTNKE